MHYNGANDWILKVWNGARRKCINESKLTRILTFGSHHQIQKDELNLIKIAPSIVHKLVN